jgi:methionyl-tRNA synthetase
MQKIRQVNNPCPKCGSFYRRGDECNICKTHAPCKDVPDIKFSLYERAIKNKKGE